MKYILSLFVICLLFSCTKDAVNIEPLPEEISVDSLTASLLGEAHYDLVDYKGSPVDLSFGTYIVPHSQGWIVTPGERVWVYTHVRNNSNEPVYGIAIAKLQYGNYKPDLNTDVLLFSQYDGDYFPEIVEIPFISAQGVATQFNVYEVPVDGDLKKLQFQRKLIFSSFEDEIPTNNQRTACVAVVE